MKRGGISLGFLLSIQEKDIENLNVEQKKAFSSRAKVFCGAIHKNIADCYDPALKQKLTAELRQLNQLRIKLAQ
jgi:hypothetical protein